jgi:hypothetical protein
MIACRSVASPWVFARSARDTFKRLDRCGGITSAVWHCFAPRGAGVECVMICNLKALALATGAVLSVATSSFFSCRVTTPTLFSSAGEIGELAAALRTRPSQVSAVRVEGHTRLRALLVFSRSETARIDDSCLNVSRGVYRISFTSICLACFRQGIMSSLKRGQSVRSALTKTDLNPPRELSATL